MREQPQWRSLVVPGANRVPAATMYTHFDTYTGVTDFESGDDEVLGKPIRDWDPGVHEMLPDGSALLEMTGTPDDTSLRARFSSSLSRALDAFLAIFRQEEAPDYPESDPDGR